MKYQNANDILPDELLSRIQEYIQGGLLYIPKSKERRSLWGERSGARRYYDERNRSIRGEYRQGTPINALAEKYGLSPESVRRILYA